MSNQAKSMDNGSIYNEFPSNKTSMWLSNLTKYSRFLSLGLVDFGKDSDSIPTPVINCFEPESESKTDCYQNFKLSLKKLRLYFSKL